MKKMIQMFGSHSISRAYECVSIVIRIWSAQFKFCIQNSYGAFTNKQIESDIQQPERIAEN